MSEPKRVSNPLFSFLSSDIEGVDSLAELALDMRWSWNPQADEVWQQFDPVLWELTHNPWVVLQTISRDQFQQAFADAAFRKKVDDLVQAKRESVKAPSWFQQNHSESPLSCVAYFSMEFMLSEALPIYSGGLGNVAGDQLKAAGDLGVPVVGVGLLYQQGYFRQVIDKNGVQQAIFPYNDPGQLPITPVRKPDGEWLRLEIVLPAYSVWLRAWQVQVGRVKLYLLDSNDPANIPAFRGITSELYGGGSELRLMQEITLGISGWRLLRMLEIKPDVCHLNEGHAAFAVLERARSFMEETGQPFDVALEVTRAGNHFTSHTAVSAGFDRFAPFLMEQYLGKYAMNRLNISLQELLALGRQNPNDAGEHFNMAYLAMRGSGSVNGVSRLHGQVSRRIFQPLFPNWPESEVPVGHVTNGVHMPTWNSKEAEALVAGACGKDIWTGTVESIEERIRAIPDSDIWQLRASGRESFLKYVRQRHSRHLAFSDTAPEEIENAKHIFDVNTLTLGFARRFATYKRPNLLLHDQERLLRILSDPKRPVQLVIAGKAHPEDEPGKAMIQQWIRFVSQPEVRKHAVFLIDYDMSLTEQMVQGVDAWINTPRRPWEACGTSGMKVLVNGGINISELDGWWAEAYAPEVGWALGDGKEHDNDPAWDAAEAEQLYALLEQQVIPEFYERDANGIPTSWVARIRESMARLTPRFSATRAVIEYTEQYYIPAAETYNGRAAGKCITGVQLVNWKQILAKKWANLRFGEVKVDTTEEQHVFTVPVYLDGLPPDAVKVELYAVGVDGGDPVALSMIIGQQLVGAEHGYVYNAQVPAARPATDYTARVRPYFPCVAVPLESALILWQR
ncbi:MAG: alpha-glucan family phosphorylase [Dissulfurispiraceae bacterium]